MSSIEKSSRETWTSEEDERLLRLRCQYWQLTWESFTQRFFPKRSRAALSWRWGMLRKNEDQPTPLRGHSAGQRQRGSRPRRGRRGGLRLASRRSARHYRPRQVSDTTEDDDDDCSWNTSEGDEDEQAAGTSEDGRDDTMLDEVPIAAASVAQVPQVRAPQPQRQSMEEFGVLSAVSPIRQSTDIQRQASPSVFCSSEIVPGHSPAHTSPALTTGKVKWQGEDPAASGSGNARLMRTTSPGSGPGSVPRSAPRSAAAVEAAAETPALVPRPSEPTSTTPEIPRLSEAARQLEAKMDQILAENSRLTIELRNFRAAYNDFVGERDKLRDVCGIVKELENKGVLDLFSRLARQ
ncbi:hypothetical protein BDV10DRAFT_180042 [Aspergillus recurvatus]